MLNLVTNQQIRKADEHTIRNLPIRSVDLMEQASIAFVEQFCQDVDTGEKITVCCGMGNNGGDGLAIARLLHAKGYKKLKVFIVKVFRNTSEDFAINRQRLTQLPISCIDVKNATELPSDLGIVIDAILGSGFHGTLDQVLVDIFRKINQQSLAIFSVDCPSGLNVDAPETKNYQGVQANKTISFQRPKLFFMFPDSVAYTRSSVFVPIGLDEDFLQSIPSDYFWVEEKDIIAKLKTRKAFSHKGTYGHLFIVAGAPHTMGAALLCARSALFSGTGLVTACIPKENFSVLNAYQPEVMTRDRVGFDNIALDQFDTVAIGPGLGTDSDASTILQKILKSQLPSVFDADALNIIAAENWLSQIPKNSILTPHLKEFDRLFGASENWAFRLEKARSKAQELQSIIVLKNQYTFVCDSDGKVYINSTGNPSMAQAGMGDVLTGCIASFLAQAYTPLEAAMIGCYLHGKSADILSESYEVTPASIVAEQIAKVWKTLALHNERRNG